MVWFYLQCTSARTAAERTTFNPTMVWFYLIKWKVVTGSVLLPAFQSHYGLILSEQRVKLLWNLLRSFNPTMVWFYPGNSSERSTNCWLLRLLSIPLWSDFIQGSYFHRVLTMSGLSIPLWSDFILHLCFHLFTVHYYFQSHYGLILSMLWKITASTSSVSFQSHYGLILSVIITVSPHTTLSPFNPTMVWFYHVHCCRLHYFYWFLSIPLWSDFIYFKGGEYMKKNLLSIPLWSDFISKPSMVFNKTRRNFQSHYGLILSQCSRQVTSTLFSLSIPLWSDFILTSGLKT